MAPPRRVIMAADVIAPGGGPAGYTFNLLAGLRARQDRAGDSVEVQASVRPGATRHRAIGDPAGPAGRLSGLIDAQPSSALTRLASQVKWSVNRADRERRRVYASADAVIFQGYQSSARARWARHVGKRIAYMPHSPSIMADEYRMLEEAASRPVSRSRYDFLKSDEERLFKSAHAVVFPSRSAAVAYEAAFGKTLAQKEVRYIASGALGMSGDGALELGAAPLVLFAGRYVEHKGYDLFLDAAELLVARGVEARFGTIGTGTGFRTSPSVRDFGWSDRPGDFVARAAVVVVPNRIAYYDLLPLEVASQGKALVMTRVGGNVDQLAVLPDALGADVDAASVADSVEDALGRWRATPTYGIGNRGAYERNFTVDRMAEQWSCFLDAFTRS